MHDRILVLSSILLVTLINSVSAATVNHPQPLLPNDAQPFLPTDKHLEQVLQRSLDARKPSMEVHNECESPTLPSGKFHILIQAHKPRTCFNHWLWDLGVTNAHVFIYRRSDAEVPLRTFHGPCGMLVQERLLMPNHGRETPIFLDYVLEHYHNPPLAVAVLHWHGPKDWHNSCEGTLGRVRYAYRGLASPQRWPGAAEYASHMTTLTRVMNDADGYWMNTSLRFFKYPNEERVPSWSTRPDRNVHGETVMQPCVDIFEKYGIDVAAKTFYSCCATFLIPWDRILSLPLAFYREMLELGLSDEVAQSDPDFGWGCWEFAVWQWYKEPELTPHMESLYVQAQNVSAGLNLTQCLTPVPENELHIC